MKLKTLLLTAGIAAAAYFLFIKKVSAQTEANQNQATETIIANFPSSQAYLDLKNAKLNTRESIIAGINVINSGQAIRSSRTLRNVGENENIAQIGSRTALVKVAAAKLDANGRTAFDNIILANQKNIR